MWQPMKSTSGAAALALAAGLALVPAAGGERPQPARAAAADPVISSVSVAPKRFCVKRTRACRRTGARLRFTLSEPAHVAGMIDPVGRPAGRLGDELDIRGRAGRNAVRLDGKGLARGVYRLALGAEDEHGNESDTVAVRFRVARSR